MSNLHLDNVHAECVNTTKLSDLEQAALSNSLSFCLFTTDLCEQETVSAVFLLSVEAVVGRQDGSCYGLGLAGGRRYVRTCLSDETELRVYMKVSPMGILFCCFGISERVVCVSLCCAMVLFNCSFVEFVLAGSFRI